MYHRYDAKRETDFIQIKCKDTKGALQAVISRILGRSDSRNTKAQAHFSLHLGLRDYINDFRGSSNVTNNMMFRAELNE